MEQKTGIISCDVRRASHAAPVGGEGILDAYKVDYRVGETHYKLVELEACFSRGSRCKEAGYVEEAGIEIFHSLPEPARNQKDDAILGSNQYISPQESFSIRVARYGGILEGSIEGQT